MGTHEFIDSHKAEPANLNSVVKMCRWLAVSTSGFYHWATRPQSATAARRGALTARIQHFFEESEGTYGYRRIHADRAAEQTECSPERVRQIMRHQGPMACQPRPFRITTDLPGERVYRTVYATKSQSRSGVIRYNGGFYNSRRRYSALGYRRPNEVHCGYQPPALAA